MNIAEELWGPPFVGAIISISLYGVTIAQTIFYYKVFPYDPVHLKWLIGFLFAMDTIHVFCLCSGFWRFFIHGRFNTDLLTETPWTISTSIIITYIIAFSVQTFFGYRVWRISNGNLIVTGIIGIAALMQIASGMAVAAYIIIAKSMSAIFDNQAGNFELASSVICDITITGSLVYYFRSCRTGIKHTEAILQRLIRVTVNMGLLGAIAAFVGLVLYHVTAGKFLCVAAHFLMSRCYVNSLMATLNARKGIREIQRDTITLETFPTTDRSDATRSTGVQLLLP
ncbi:hypothetical protein PILCRDRAFT_821833 [Piloderma croceum F 1598]|uniref:DUF6534 domain-containing protein n=1 Tax=Piloderma croceum (strain F 1598) TaxID=765440 RepID=A0A0C3F8B0_PILCF|nr:hypothetical protein PILCRDRAFT_821833 [Piloderma croceum F 1598]